MAKKKQLETLITVTNTSFFDFRTSQNELINRMDSDEEHETKIKKVNNACKLLFDEQTRRMVIGGEKEERFRLLSVSDFSTLRRDVDEERLVYEIIVGNNPNEYSLSTGLFCGMINFGSGKPSIEIRTGYSDTLLRRMLSFCCGIYADMETKEDSSASSSLYSLLIPFLYLISLRKVASRTFPAKYEQITERGYSVNGEVDINEYINHDLLSSDGKITYRYLKRVEIQEIIDVLYLALKQCKKVGSGVLPRYLDLERYLSDSYSGARPSKNIIKNIEKNRHLKTGMYSDFKRPLQLARMLLEREDLTPNSGGSVEGVGGFVIDSSFLWEMYLYNLFKLHLSEWDIQAQEIITFYEGTFFKHKNYPDFVLRNKKTGSIYILDAKFKRMGYRSDDVDNKDLQQVHSYGLYYHLKHGDKFKGCALIYPAKEFRPKDKKNVDDMFGIDNLGKKFGVFSLKDPTNGETIMNNERVFIEELKEFLES